VISPESYGISFTNVSTGNHVQGNMIAGAKSAGIYADAQSSSNSIIQNWMGESASGQSFPNGNYGVEVLSSSNTVLQNSFGPNGIGSVFVGSGTNGNSIGYTPQPTLSSLGAQIDSIFDNFFLMVQAVENRDFSGFFNALQGYVNFIVIVETELLSLQRM
jgi:hypothetical protein